MLRDNDNLVSIGIPFYNAEKYIGFAILSILNQTYDNWELILLDDGSNDNSLNITYSFKDKRIKIISDGINKGLIYRLNQLTSIAKGKYYARMDADDIMHPDRIKFQVDYLYSHPDVDVIGSQLYIIDKNNAILGKRTIKEFVSSKKEFIKYGCFAHPTIMGKTDWFVNNPYDEQYLRMEDFELWFRTVDKSTFRNINKPLLYYRIVSNDTLTKYVQSYIGIIKLFQERDKFKITKFESTHYQIVYFIKIIIYTFFSITRMNNLIIKARTKKLKQSELITSNRDLNYAVTPPRGSTE